MKQKIKGGRADKMEISDFNEKALKKGIKVEYEHTNDIEIAAEIAMDHLSEDKNYYDKLEKMEKGNPLKEEIEHYKWFIERKKNELKGPYNTVAHKKNLREQIKEIEEKLEIAKEKIKEEKKKGNPMKKVSQAEMIALIMVEVPKLKPVPSEKFGDEYENGIWFKSEYDEENPLFEKLEKILEKNGWYFEPYDSGTMLAFQNIDEQDEPIVKKSNPNNATQIHLKEWVKPMAELHARTYCEDVLGLEKDDKKYVKEFEKSFYSFCKEFYENSLVPHAMNPTIRKGTNIYDIYKDDFNKLLNGENQEVKNEMFNQIVKGASGIVSTLISSEMGHLKTGLKGVENKKDSIEDRYKQTIFIALTMGLIKGILKLKKNELDSYVKDLLKNETWKVAQSKKKTTEFASKLKDIMDSEIKSFVPMESIKNNLK